MDDDAARPLSILLVTDKVPGHDNGYGIRVGNVLAGLRAAGDVHVCLIDSSEFRMYLPDDAGYTTSRLRIENPPRWAKVVRLRHLLPANVRYRRPDVGRARLADLIGRQPWDVVWCSRVRVHLLTDGVASGPRIVDFDDLNDRLLRTEIADRRARHGTLAMVPRNTRDWIDARLWSRLQRRVASTVARVVVCSGGDRAYLGVPNGAVVPNGYPEPPPAGARANDEPPHRIVFVGPLTYEPNRLAVEWFIKDVLPTITAALADVELVVVGDDRDVVVEGVDQPGVTLTGFVPDVSEQYAAASIAVVPVHSGGGTRVKVIEALARSVPLVSTPFGCAGHGLVPDEELLVANDAASFADACVRLLTDRQLRDLLVASGRRRFTSTLTSRATSDAVRQLVHDVASDGRDRSCVDHGSDCACRTNESGASSPQAQGRAVTP